MKKITVLVLLLIVTLNSCSNYKSQKKDLEIKAEDISRRIDGLFKYNDTRKRPGFGFLVIHQGEVLHSAGYGMADFNEELAISPITTFEDVTIMAEMINISILKLAQEGSLYLSDSIIQFIPELTGIISSEATIEQLLIGTSGLWDTWEILDDQETWNSEEFVNYFMESEEPTRFSPGEGCSFTGIAAFGLGPIIIEKASGMTLDIYLTETFIEPLQMNASFIVTDSDGPTADVVNYRRRTDGYSPIIESELDYHPMINTTLQDIIKWYNAIDQGEVLSEEELNIYYSRAANSNGNFFVDEENDMKDYFTGYKSMAGYIIETIEDGIISYSTGTNEEYGSASLYFPDQELRVFIYSNSPGGRGLDFVYGSFMPRVGWEWFQD